MGVIGIKDEFDSDGHGTAVAQSAGDIMQHLGDQWQKPRIGFRTYGNK